MRRETPEWFKRATAFGTIGGAVGGAVGGYVAVTKQNVAYGAACLLAGALVGQITGLLLYWRGRGQSGVLIEQIVNVVLAVLALLLAVAGLVGFLSTRRWTLLVGAIFFAGCATMLFLVIVRGKAER